MILRIRKSSGLSVLVKFMCKEFVKNFMGRVLSFEEGDPVNNDLRKFCLQMMGPQLLSTHSSMIKTQFKCDPSTLEK